jgi:organic hydroperoxide reductase OsmC/OhrA
MSRHEALIEWERKGGDFANGGYSRLHRWAFDGGLELPASASPHIVPRPYSVAEAIDPEEAFVASLASCHMLWFLSIAAKAGFTVESYRDRPVGILGRNADRKLQITEVDLRPEVEFSGVAGPSAAEHEAMHDEAHRLCFLANSVTTRIRCTPLIAGDAGRGLR